MGTYSPADSAARADGNSSRLTGRKGGVSEHRLLAHQPVPRRMVIRRMIIGVVIAAMSLLASFGGLLFANTVHATPEDTISLSSSEPRNAAVLEAAPTELVITFDREVALDVEDTSALTCTSQVMVLGDGEFENERTTIRYEITGAVPKGNCLWQWKLANAADDTIASGTISFDVAASPQTTPPTTAPSTTGAATEGGTNTTAAPADGASPAPATTAAPAAQVPTTTGDAQSSAGFDPFLWFSRLLSTSGILVLFGALVIIATGWPEGPEYYITTRFLQVVWGISLVATLIYIVAYAAQVRGDSLAGGLSPAAWLDLSNDGWPGIGALARLVAVAGSGYVALRPERLDDPNSGLWAWILPGIAVITVALSRVAGPAALVGVGLGVVHAFASAVWFGGAVFVGRVVLAGPGEEDLVVATRAYSRTSLVAILATVVTGVMQYIRLDSGDLFGSHGRVAIFKMLAVGVMLFIGLEARKQVRFRLDREYEMSPNNAARFRRAYGTETVFGIIALALSSLMVSISPGTELPWAGEEYVETLTFADPNSGVNAVVEIGPLKAGRNGYLIQVSEPPLGITDLRLRFIPPAGTQNGQAWVVEDVVPLRGRGSVWRPTEVGIPLDVPGTWKLRMESTTQQDSQSAMEVTFVVQPADGASTPSPSAPTNTTTPTSGSTAGSAPPASINRVTPSTTQAPEATPAP